MSMNATPSSARVHIGIFGRRNAGKSSLMNALTGQELSIVSEHLGTTTDPVSKSMELLPMGPVVIFDTPGLDDVGDLGALRVRKAAQVLNKTDVALVVIDPTVGIAEEETALIAKIEQKKIPYIVVYNKSDIATAPDGAISVSAATGAGINELKERIASLKMPEPPRLLEGLCAPGDVCVLVTPIDSAAPKGRMILPQQQVMREVLDNHGIAPLVQPEELKAVLGTLNVKPRIVITDSQAFGRVSRDVPEDIPLTSFSILFARQRGFLNAAIEAVKALPTLKDGDKLLICEGCTHHRQCDDIGTVKIPRWLMQNTGKHFEFEWTSGTGFPDDLTPYSMVIHCGACMLNPREVTYRMNCALDQGIPFINYGILIAALHGVLERSIRPLGLSVTQ
ncbi:MAG: [FeFe] hydrogenase H-cluster maturation GTPase HydF [Clostridiales bacterium]|nr:[FeFe] hydrogenase H-cluster maturation GTPase HydF [Clostridiales bacterium]MDY4201219.1 [FeFe] hydrogenase H-cluster maturation GTPase HydF [Candidatus Fimadaptatus sp.]